MLLDYHIGLDFASEAGSWNVGDIMTDISNCTVFSPFAYANDRNDMLNSRYVVSHSSHIHPKPSQREGVAALPYAEIFCLIDASQS